MVVVRRKSRARGVVGVRDFTDGDLVRLRELVAVGMGAGHFDRDWEHELEVLHHVRGRVRGMMVKFLWQLDSHRYTLDEAVAEELDLSVPADGRGIDRRFGAKFCGQCEGLIHGWLHVVGDRYAKGCAVIHD